ncbi:MAG: hypothetical protein CFE23_11765 [Flavobacterium sp. BFFFF1]|uniref:hypothetical protein n=1 Tax=Flavobacterium sp. BFFFF1 TaxID=2015557 RepID=UPI000BC3FF96|nr:hypothetical protein [Flavobacterium sp. BFFFF1]OYU79925.1 MAG: hypothetical protein CFE23_11765 [Flavobacterium sp. BFFFF1]
MNDNKKPDENTIDDLQNHALQLPLEQQLSTLKPADPKETLYTAVAGTRGHNEIGYQVVDLLKVSIMALDSEYAQGPTSLSASPNLNVMGVLEIALALLPYAGFAQPDNLRREGPGELPAYNYSTLRIIG